MGAQYDTLFYTMSSQVISAAEVDVWKKEVEDLETDIKNLQYPPCFCIIAIPSTNTVKLAHLRFKTSEKDTTDINLILSNTASSPVKPIAIGGNAANGTCKLDSYIAMLGC